jgi:hypothetical protein
LESYAHNDSDILKRPTPIKQLPTGPDYKALYYLFNALKIDESTIDGNIELFGQFLKQLQLDDEEGKKFVKDRVFLWGGDQMTTARERTIVRQRRFEENSFDRFDWLVPVITLFHTIMTFGKALHKQYSLTNTGLGLAQAVNKLLHRKHLAKSATQGNFHHHLEELYYHVGYGRFLCAWMTIAGVESLEDLRSCRPEELKQLAGKIREELASSRAIHEHDRRPEAEQDQIFRQTIHFNRDLLDYLIIDSAIKTGDVGLIEALIPQLLFHFIGAGSTNYSHEMLELLQGLHREWPESLRCVTKLIVLKFS